MSVVSYKYNRGLFYLQVVSSDQVAMETDVIPSGQFSLDGEQTTEQVCECACM